MKWHKIDHPNGTSEIVQVIDRSNLQKWPPQNKLGYELSIFWLCPIDDLDYVRAAFVQTRKRSGRIKIPRGTLLGYSSLVADAPLCVEAGAFIRRAFYLRDGDQPRNAQVIPKGAVDPLTLLPGRPGRAPDPAGDARGYRWLGTQQMPLSDSGSAIFNL